MIKARELRIGNYIMVEFQHLPILNGKEIDDGHAVIFPIKLNGIVLSKCGFEKVNHKDGYIFYHHNKEKIRIYSNRTEYRGNFIPHCKYLHQLQNLYFALTEKELMYKP
jgi:hypothetical protein